MYAFNIFQMNSTSQEVVITQPLLLTDPHLAIPYLGILCFATLVGFIGNIVLIMTFLTNKSLQRVGNEFILNLAIADFFVVSIANPLCIIGKDKLYLDNGIINIYFDNVSYKS